MLDKEVLLNSKDLGFKITIEYYLLGSPKKEPTYFRLDLPSKNVSGGSQVICKVVQIGHDTTSCWYGLYIDSKYIDSNVGGTSLSSYITHNYTFTMPNKDIIIRLYEGYGKV